MYKVDLQVEQREILSRYRRLITAWEMISGESKTWNKQVKKAFKLAVSAHKDMRRKTGEPYVYHPIEVAYIAVSEIGLGETSIICALLHDVVEDTSYTIEDISRLFGDKIAQIVDGLTKIKVIFDKDTLSIQAENFKKMLLTLSDDVRVILIKLCDRLHNMRTLDAMPKHKQLKIVSETSFLFAPLAHRLGLYDIKSELEDLCFKYTDNEAYNLVAGKIYDTAIERKLFIDNFIYPIKKALAEKSIDCQIIGREKSAFSIWNKMAKKGIPFDEVYDIFAIRIIIDCETQDEKYICWQAYSIVTDYYSPKQNRLRDWISTPKPNGYESLHTTVMSSTGQWVEVQIRTKRMNEIAEKGYAAHWRYKNKNNNSNESNLDNWLDKIKDVFKDNNSGNALAFIEDFKKDALSDEIIVFTPKGKLITLPLGATLLDFAYEIHSELGNTCIGGKVNHKLAPIDYKLNTGDQVEIITSIKQIPNEKWLNFIVTAKAKKILKEALKFNKKQAIEAGQLLYHKYVKDMQLENSKELLEKFRQAFNNLSANEFYYNINSKNITAKDLKGCIEQTKSGLFDFITRSFSRTKKVEVGANSHIKIFDKTDANSGKYQTSHCCNPIFGDDVIGFKGNDNVIWIHRTKCNEAAKVMSKYGDRVVAINWENVNLITYQTGIIISGFDKHKLLIKIVSIISEKMGIDIKSFNISADKDIFNAKVVVIIKGKNELNDLIKLLKNEPEINSVQRVDDIN